MVVLSLPFVAAVLLQDHRIGRDKGDAGARAVRRLSMQFTLLSRGLCGFMLLRGRDRETDAEGGKELGSWELSPVEMS